ncbi:MAG: type III pantothenate kinase [Deltaproteobacteria bacterium]|nr:type III pantothenate kinase [Deltaproteobacteria bacterium]
MLLAIDVGNTHTVLGLLNGREVIHTFRVRTISRTTDETGLCYRKLLDSRGISLDEVEGAIVSSVVPDGLFSIEKAVRLYLHRELMVVGRHLKTGIRIRTDNPREVGADRVVNAVAAVERWGGPVVVVDFGTATTFDCVNRAGEYVGGAISPGLKISEEALFDRTAKLPRVSIERPPRAIGTNTVHAMQSGLYFGYVGLVDGLVDRIVEELGDTPRVVATGGLANLVASESRTIEEVDSHLTLRGLAILYEMNTTPR